MEIRPANVRGAFPRMGRRTALAAGAGCALVLVIGGVSLAALLPRIVTILAFRDAIRLSGELSASMASSPHELFEFRLIGENPENRMAGELAKTYGALFRKGFIDPGYWMAQVPELGFTPDALPAYLVLLGYYEAYHDPRLGDTSPRIAEGVRWVRPLFDGAAAKESMVNLLLRDVEPVPGQRQSGGLLKVYLICMLTFRDVDDYGLKDRQPELEAAASRIISALGIEAWEPVLRHVDHPREKTRAGALLLLCQHPDPAVFTARARAALADRAEVVRIAAAGTLAYHGIADGEDVLVAALDHERWEARWWSGKSLTYLGGETARKAIRAWKEREADPDMKGEISEMLDDMK